MPYYPEDQSDENIKKIIRQNVCAECGRQVCAYYDIKTKRQYIACTGQIHEGIERVYKEPKDDYQTKIRREHEMEQKHGRETALALAGVPRQGQLTQPQAEHILSLVYPGVPKNEIIRCAILCRDFGLHPLMKEVYIIPFGQGEKRTWSTVLGINATRKMMGQRGSYSYTENTPRIMTENEQMQIFGEVDQKNIVAITKLKTKDGLEAPGYGRWPKDANPYGMDKGNTKANMAFIRSERNAFNRLCPDALPPDIDIIDEAYAEVPDIGKVNTKTGEIIEGEAKVLPDEEEQPELEPLPVGDEVKESLIDQDWLKESMKTLQATGNKAYTDESMLSYMKSVYKVEGKEIEGEDIYEIASKLEKGMANHFTKVIQDALDKI